MAEGDLPHPSRQRSAAQRPAESLANLPVALGGEPGGKGVAVQHAPQRLAAARLDLRLARAKTSRIEALRGGGQAEGNRFASEAQRAQVVHVSALGAAAGHSAVAGPRSLTRCSWLSSGVEQIAAPPSSRQK
ncbi:unnamed protein product [Prorocentrum cordatum]|uniref:Uncharacterized protein n=1 Tax=Prorocentrum cordatum TaxID=2364126 RepID=A0ABN9P8N0_9DINO|nr:unnamed protein product [Polarella glacialis]